MSINTAEFSEKLRARAIDVPQRKLLITNYIGSEQEGDLSDPANCNGFGRIRHFRRHGTAGWPDNPLPIDPAANKLGLPQSDLLVAQVFQNAACNWRCWYCFVPFDLLSARSDRAGWLSASEILDLYEKEHNAPLVIDLSGGQPDLTPEWVPWMMRELQRRGLDSKVYFWSDDNLSNDYFWRFLTDEDRRLISAYLNYGKVCCFKGFDPASFAFNTAAAPDLFEQQIALFRRYLDLGIDLYAYATFTTPTAEDVAALMSKFVDQLQSIHPNLPLRVVPLEIRAFAPMHNRMHDDHHRALELQWDAIRCWNVELEKRFSTASRQRPIYAIPL